MGRVLLRNAVTTLGRRFVRSGDLSGRFFAIDRDGTVRIKVIQNGDGYQLQRLGDGGKILNVRPASVEEYRLYETAREQSQVAERAYGAQKQAEERAKSAETELRYLRPKLEQAEGLLSRRTERLAEAESLADRFAAEADNERARAEAAEAERDELRTPAVTAEAEAEAKLPRPAQMVWGSPVSSEAYEAHNGR